MNLNNKKNEGGGSVMIEIGEHQISKDKKWKFTKSVLVLDNKD